MGIVALFILVACFTVPTTVKAQEGSIAVSADPSSHICELHDGALGVRTVHVLHTYSIGAVASRFKVALGPGVTMTYLSEVHPFAMTAGNTQDGISICYGACLTGGFLVASIDYMGYGTSSNCSKVLVVPHPAAQIVEATDCGFRPVQTFVQDLAVFPTGGGCGCPPAHSFVGAAQVFSCTPVPVEATTWGAVKALYAK